MTEDKVVGGFCEWATTALGVPVLRSHQMTATPAAGQYLTVGMLLLSKDDAEFAGASAEVETWAERWTATLDINAHRRAGGDGQTPVGEYPSALLQTLASLLRYAELDCFTYLSSGVIRPLKDLANEAFGDRAQMEVTVGGVAHTDISHPTIDALDTLVLTRTCP